jgi:hypothetical protein
LGEVLICQLFGAPGVRQDGIFGDVVVEEFNDLVGFGVEKPHILLNRLFFYYTLFSYSGFFATECFVRREYLAWTWYAMIDASLIYNIGSRRFAAGYDATAPFGPSKRS